MSMEDPIAKEVRGFLRSADSNTIFFNYMTDFKANNPMNM